MYVIEFAVEDGSQETWHPVLPRKAYNPKPVKFATEDDARKAIRILMETQPQLRCRVSPAPFAPS